MEGPILVFGGVYSNFQALEAMYEKATQLGLAPTQIICTGDIIGYCAQPEACIQFIKKWGIHAIAGNVELSIREEEEDCGCNFNEGSRCDLFSKQWFPFAQAALSLDSRKWIASLPTFLRFSFKEKQVLVLHGSYFNTSEFIFQSTNWPIKERNFAATSAEVICAGHCGLPFIDAKEGKTWFNSGVIGMPANDGTPRVWYGKLSARGGGLHFEICTLTYDHALAAQKMQENPLPLSYAKTLVNGIWDNCEILPESETKNQGKQLVEETFNHYQS